LHLLDGRSAQPQTVSLHISEHSAHVLSEHDGHLLLSIPLAALHRQTRWPEATVRGSRIIEFTDHAPPGWQGAQLLWPSAQNPAEFDAWAAEHVSALANPSANWIVRAQNSWRGVATALVLLVALCAALYVWGVPLAARGVTALIPVAADQAIGKNALNQIDGRWMKPSQLPPVDQQRLRERFLASVRTQFPNNTPSVQLEFRKSEIGPNAFALPGGIVVMTDELIRLVKDDDVVMGVLGHELGHVTRRHGMRQLVQVGVMQGILSVAFGDYGSLITTAPLILGSMAYSRAHEREADDDTIAFMQANSISPLVMVKFFQAARAYRSGANDNKDNTTPPGEGTAPPDSKQHAGKTPKTMQTPLGFSIISSHPLDEERMDKFRQAAQR